MVLVYKVMQITTLEDIQKLKMKDLREILRFNSAATGGIKPYDRVRISSKVAIILLFDLGKIKRILVSKDQNNFILSFFIAQIMKAHSTVAM